MPDIRTLAIRDWRRFNKSSFNLFLHFTSPLGETVSIRGKGQNNHIQVGTDGEVVFGHIVHISFSEAELLEENSNYVTRDSKDLVDFRGHLVRFNDARGQELSYRVVNTYPDNMVGMIMADCEFYEL